MDRATKIIKAKQIEEQLANAAAALVMDYRGLSVKELEHLRRLLREGEGNLKVVKNRLAKRAITDHQVAPLSELISGPTAIIYTHKDPVGIAKKTLEFLKEKESIEIRGGILGNELIGLDEIKALAKTQPREVLMAQLVGLMQAPLSSLMNILAGTPRGLLNILNGIKENRQTGDQASPEEEKK